MYALAFSPDGRTLITIADAGQGPRSAAAVVGQTGVKISDFGFAWNVANPNVSDPRRELCSSSADAR